MVSFIVFVLGLVVGSFLNSVIYRLEKGESALRGRSYCPHCKHTLSWQDLIPILSFVLLQGKCRYCKKPISWQYPLVELATGILFVAVAQLAVSNQQLAYLLIVNCLLLIIFVYDLKHYLIPDKILYPAILVSSIWYLVSSIFFGLYTKYFILNTFYAAFGAALFFFLIHALSKGRAMGFGDVKLALFMGLFLGWPNILVAFFAAFLSGAAAGIFLILLKKKTLKSQVPFGPFLIGGTFFALFFGSAVVNWYLGLLMV